MLVKLFRIEKKLVADNYYISKKLKSLRFEDRNTNDRPKPLGICISVSLVQ